MDFITFAMWEIFKYWIYHIIYIYDKSFSFFTDSLQCFLSSIIHLAVLLLCLCSLALAVLFLLAKVTQKSLPLFLRAAEPHVDSCCLKKLQKTADSTILLICVSSHNSYLYYLSDHVAESHWPSGAPLFPMPLGTPEISPVSRCGGLTPGYSGLNCKSWACFTSKTCH